MNVVLRKHMKNADQSFKLDSKRTFEYGYLMFPMNLASLYQPNGYRRTIAYCT